jgi:O-antigen ligase
VLFYYLLLLIERFHEWPYLAPTFFTLIFVPITPVKIAGFAAVGVALFTLAPADAAPRLPSALGVLFNVFAFFPLITTIGFGLPMPEASLSYLISLDLMLLATRGLLSNYARLRGTVRAVVVVGALSTLWSFKQAVLQNMPEGRGWGVSQDSNYEALALIVMIPLALWLARSREDRRWRRFGTIAAVALTAAAILTESRGAMIGLGLVALQELFGRGRSSRYRAALAAGFLVAILFAPSSLWQRMQTIQISGKPVSGDAVSTEVRWEILVAGFNMIRAHPVLGVGLDLFKQVSPQYNPELGPSDAHIAHNTYLQVGAEGGLPTLGLFMLLMSMALRNCRAARRIDPESPLADLASAVRMSILAYAAAAVFLTANNLVWYWLLVFMSQNLLEVATAASSNHQTRATQPARLPAIATGVKLVRAAG